MKPAVLFYDPLPVPWADRLRQTCAIQGLRLRPVGSQDLERTVEALALGLQPSGELTAGPALPEPMLVLCGLSEGQLDRLLAALGRMGARGCLKAALTVHNAQWTLRALYAELVKERLQLS